MNIGIFLLIAIAGIWSLGIFLGFIGGLSKTFTKTPTAMDSTDIKSQEEQTIRDTEEKRKAMMEDMKQKIDDASHKY